VNYAQAAKNALVAQVGGGSSSPSPVTTKTKGGPKAATGTNPSVSPEAATPTGTSVSVNVAGVTVATGAPLNVPTTLQTVTHATTQRKHGPAVPKNKAVVSE
jgi:hypothetical protein